MQLFLLFFFFSSRRRHTRSDRDWSSDVCSSDLLALRERLFPPLFASTTVPFRPAMVPPTTKVLVAQLTTTPVTLPEPTAPVPPLTVHACTGAPGCVCTVTANVAPLASGVANVKAPP